MSKQQRPPAFSDVVAEVRKQPAAGSSTEIPSPLREGHWTDAMGVVYRRRGEGQPSTARVRHLVADPSCLVVLCYLGEESYLEGEARTRLLAEVESHIVGKLDHGPNDHTDYRAGEFKDANSRRALIFERSC